MNRISPTVKQLLIINLIFYFGSSISLNTEFIYSLFSLHFPENPDFKFWQLITHMFMHGGILHLALVVNKSISFEDGLKLESTIIKLLNRFYLKFHS